MVGGVAVNVTVVAVRNACFAGRLECVRHRCANLVSD